MNQIQTLTPTTDAERRQATPWTVKDVVALFGQPLDKGVFHVDARMIGGKDDAHGASLGEAPGIRHPWRGQDLKYFRADSRRCGQPGQQHGRRLPASTSS